MQTKKTVTLPYGFMRNLYCFISDKLDVVSAFTQLALLKEELAKKESEEIDKDRLLQVYRDTLKKIKNYIFDEAKPQLIASQENMFKVATISPVKN